MLTTPRADRVVLHNLSWQQYESILTNPGDRRLARIAYCDQELEIMNLPMVFNEKFPGLIEGFFRISPSGH